MWCDNVKWTKPKQGGSCLTKGSGRACSASKSLLKGLTEGCQVVLSRLNAGMVAGVHPLEESRSVTPVGGYMGWHVYYWPWEWASLIERQVEQKIQSADQGSTSRESGGARVCASVCVCNERGAADGRQTKSVFNRWWSGYRVAFLTLPMHTELLQAE